MGHLTQPIDKIHAVRKWRAHTRRAALQAGVVFFFSLFVAIFSPVGADAKTDILTIVTSKGNVEFKVELAITPAQQSKGLMFRRSMAENEGMLFDFGSERMINMWMRNTYIPLDMVFAFEDGTIHRIAAQTEPHSEKTISSGEKVRYVFEINSGAAQRQGIAPGDRIEHPIIGKK